MTTPFYPQSSRKVMRSPGQITIEQINDFFTQLPQPQTQAITNSIQEVHQAVRLPPQTLVVEGEGGEELGEYSTKPTTLFQLCCHAIGSDLRTLSVCKDILPRALLVAVKHFLPVEEYLCFKSATLKCVCCQFSLYRDVQPQCPQCSRLVKKEAIRTLLVTGRL